MGMANSSVDDIAIRIRAVGDTMLGNSPNQMVPHHNFLEEVLADLRKSDLTFANYEGTLCDRNLISHKCRSDRPLCFAFRGPTRLAADLAASGIQLVNLANNHIFDYGHTCATDTADALRAKGITAIGLKSAVSAPDDEIFSSLNVKGLKIAAVGIHYSNAWGRVLSINETQRVRQVIQRVRPHHDLVLVSVHWGAEGIHTSHTPHQVEVHRGENRGHPRLQARQLIDAGADLVIGHGPHVLRGLELYKDRLIIHSLGNFATYTLFSLAMPMNLGAIVEVGLSRSGRFVEGEVISTHQYYEQTRSGARGPIRLKLDPQERALQEIQRLSESDFKDRPAFSGRRFHVDR